MIRWVKELDRILRGEATRLPALREGTIGVAAGPLSVLIVLLGAFYGACMGCFAVFGSGSGAAMQVLAAAAKVPALFLLTLVVTFPSLYVFNALVGSRLAVTAVLRLLVAALAVTMALLASFGTITVFFSVCTTSYRFMLLLNVLVFTIAGSLGLKFLLQTLHRLSLAAEPPAKEAPDEADDQAAPPGALDPLEGRLLGPHVRSVFRCWVLLFAVVGAQMAWVLRPFVGNPGQPFEWFRTRESNFFEAVWNTFLGLWS